MIHYIGKTSYQNVDFQTDSTTFELVEYFRNHTSIQLDLETQGLNPRKGNIITIQLGDRERQYVIELTDREICPLVRSLLHRNDDVCFIGHNLKFDAKWLLTYGIELNLVWDTMLAERVIHTGDHFGKSFGLKDVLYRRMNLIMDKAMQSSFVDHEGDLSAEQIQYAAFDVKYLHDIVDAQMVDIRKRDLLNVVKLENKVMLSFADMEIDGLRVDIDAWRELAIEAEDVRDSLLLRMDDMILTRDELERFKPRSFQVSMFGTEAEDRRDSVGIKWSSQKDVLPVIQHVTTQALESLDTKVLKRDFGGTHNLVDSFIDFVDVNKKATSFGQAWIEKYVEGDRVHTKINQIMATGRVASTAPNMQQIPSDARYRDCFKPTDGYTFITTDYGSQELVVIATGAKDPVWLEALENGKDLHSICAALVFGEKWDQATEEGCEFAASNQKCGCSDHKTLRTRTKAISFGLAYGAGARSLSETLEISEPDAEELMENYFKTFPAIKGWLDGNARSALSRRFSVTFSPIRRKRFYGDPDQPRETLDFKSRGMIDRRGRNTVIQGTAADMTKLAQIYLRDHLQDHRDEARLVAAVHDELLVEARIGTEDHWASIVSQCMEKAAKVILGNSLCKATPEIGAHWAK